MTLPPVFCSPTGDDLVGDRPFHLIAKHVGCGADEVFSAFEGMEYHERLTRGHLGKGTETVLALSRAARYVENLLDVLRQLPAHELEELRAVGASTPAQLTYLQAVLEGNPSGLKGPAGLPSPQIDRNPAADAIAEAMRRLFRRLRREIEYSYSSESVPSTPFAYAVEYAFAAFGVRADWRYSTERAVYKMNRIRGRHIRMALLRQRRVGNVTK